MYEWSADLWVDRFLLSAYVEVIPDCWCVHAIDARLEFKYIIPVNWVYSSCYLAKFSLSDIVLLTPGEMAGNL